MCRTEDELNYALLLTNLSYLQSSIEYRESLCSTEDYDVAKFMPTRARSRGRGRKGGGRAGSRGVERQAEEVERLVADWEVCVGKGRGRV